MININLYNHYRWHTKWTPKNGGWSPIKVDFIWCCFIAAGSSDTGIFERTAKRLSLNRRKVSKTSQHQTPPESPEARSKKSWHNKAPLALDNPAPFVRNHGHQVQEQLWYLWYSCFYSWPMCAKDLDSVLTKFRLSADCGLLLFPLSIPHQMSNSRFPCYM